MRLLLAKAKPLMISAQWHISKVGSFLAISALEEAENRIPGKKKTESRIKPLPFSNGHGRYITVINL